VLSDDVIKNNECLPWLAAAEERLGETDLYGEHIWLRSQRSAKFLGCRDELAVSEQSASDRVMGHRRGEWVEFHAASPAARGVAPQPESSVESSQGGEDIGAPWVKGDEAVQFHDARTDGLVLGGMTQRRDHAPESLPFLATLQPSRHVPRATG